MKFEKKTISKLLISVHKRAPENTNIYACCSSIINGQFPYFSTDTLVCIYSDENGTKLEQQNIEYKRETARLSSEKRMNNTFSTRTYY